MRSAFTGRNGKINREASVSVNAGCSYFIAIIGNGYLVTYCETNATDGEFRADVTVSLADAGTGGNGEGALLHVGTVADFYCIGTRCVGRCFEADIEQSASTVTAGSFNLLIIEGDGYWLAGQEAGAADGDFSANGATHWFKAQAGQNVESLCFGINAVTD